MENIISVLVVLLFFFIVFRKRLAPLFKGKAKPDKQESPAAPSGDQATSTEKVNVYFKVFAVNVGEYLNTGALSDAIDSKVHMEVDLINRTYVGEIMDLDVKINGDLLLFLIKWHT